MQEANGNGRRVVLWLVVILLIALLGIKLFTQAQVYVPVIQRFIAKQGDYEQLRYFTPRMLATAQIGEMLPRGACLATSFPPDDVTFDAIISKYLLFPVKFSDRWPNLHNQAPPQCQGHYYLDFHGRSDNAALSSGKESRELLGLKVWAQDSESHFLKRPAAVYPRIKILVGFLAFQLGILGAGLFLLRCWGIRRDVMGRGGLLSAAFLVGTVLVGTLWWGLLVAGVSLTGLKVASSVAVLLGVLFVLSRRKTSPERGSVPVADPAGPEGIPSEEFTFLDRLITVATGTLIAYYAVCTLALPVNVWDEMHIWLLKSKMMYFSQKLTFDYTVFTNNYYPLLWPVDIAAQYALVGGAYDEMAKWTAALVFLAFSGILLTLARYLGLTRSAARLAGLVFLAGFSNWTFFTALTENIYIALAALAVYSALQYLVERRTAFGWLVWLSLLGVSSVKYEGAVIAAFLFLAYLCSGCGRSRRELADEIRLAAPFLFILGLPLLWQAWLKLQQIPFTIYHFQSAFSVTKFFLTLDMIRASFLNWQNVGMGVLLALAFALQGTVRSWSRPERLLLILTGWLVLFSVAAGMGWAETEMRYYPEVMTRLFARATPFLILIWASRVLRRP